MKIKISGGSSEPLVFDLVKFLIEKGFKVEAWEQGEDNSCPHWMLLATKGDEMKINSDSIEPLTGTRMVICLATSCKLHSQRDQYCLLSEMEIDNQGECEYYLYSKKKENDLE